MPCWELSNSFWQLCRILSKTGAVSATESLITSSTSAAAVCCSSASCVSLNSRAFWIAITAWSAKVISSASSFALKPPSVRRISAIAPMPRSPCSIGARIIA